MVCTLCTGALPEGEWCRACGEGSGEQTSVEPMTGLRLAVRLAKGGPLIGDGAAEREAFYAAVALRAAMTDEASTNHQGGGRG